MTAPGGLCEHCGSPLQWTFWKGEMWTSCDVCLELPLSTDLAVGESRDEAVRRDEELFDEETSDMLGSLCFAKEG